MGSTEGVLVVCEDAGAAAALCHVAAKLAADDLLRDVLVGDRASAAFRSAGVVHRVVTDPSSVDDESLYREPTSVVLTGTTMWGLRLEARAVRAAMAHGLRTVSFVDWWGNYVDRLSFPIRGDRGVVPDQLAVVDEQMAEELVGIGIAPERVRITGSPAFDRLFRAEPLTGRVGGPVLFLSQPFRELYGAVGPGHALGYTEQTALADLAHALAVRGRTLLVRPHPRENASELGRFVAGLGAGASLYPEGTLAEAAETASVVVGMTTMALVELALRGMPTISYQPAAILPVRLPTIRSGRTVLVTAPDEIGQALDASRAQVTSIASDVGLAPDATDRVVALIRAAMPF